jgi:hypothetical protein
LGKNQYGYPVKVRKSKTGVVKNVHQAKQQCNKNIDKFPPTFQNWNHIQVQIRVKKKKSAHEYAYPQYNEIN